MFYWSRTFQFLHPCRKHLPTSGTSLFRISKQSQNNVFFAKKTSCLKVFFWTHGKLFWKICWKSFAKKSAIFPSLPERQEFLVCDKLFCSKSSTVHVESLPSSFKLYSKWLWTRRFQFDTTGGYFCQDSGTLPLKVEKRFNVVFLMK